MRTAVAVITLAVLVLAPRAAHAQISFDARRLGMGGVSLGRDGNASRFNPAYRAVKNRSGGGTGAPKITIPVPIGLYDFFRLHPISNLTHDPMFNPDSAAFNPVQLLNLVLNPPLYYDIRKPAAPTNDVQFTIGKNELIMDLGASKVLIPDQTFGIGTSGRLLDLGMGVGPVHVSVMGFVQYNIGFTLDSALQSVLKDTVPVRPDSSYSILTDAIAQTGLSPTVSYAGRVWHPPVALDSSAGKSNENADDGLYFGAAAHYYFGATYGRGVGPAGFTVGNPIFGVAPTVLFDGVVHTSNRPNGHGVGADVGVAWISGPFEVGVGANDLGAQLTWPDTKIQRIQYDANGDSITTTILANHVESTTKLPVSYIANAALRMGTGTTVGGDVFNAGRGTVIHVGAEQRYGPFAVRGGVARDQRKKLQFGFGGGLRMGAFGLDVGVWTHSNTLADTRAMTMATSISVY
ncbi:MAG TPA: hypothetical protein VG454_15250 [Gemmatimonadales bacterium]|nr:hypothetical protein [Gemmatimonadales bacterium]